MAYAPYTLTIPSGFAGVITLPFAYIDRSHVKVYYNGVLKTKDTDYTYLSTSQIRLSPIPATGTVVKLERATPAEPLVSFVAGAVIPVQDLNTAMLQALYRVEELIIASAPSVAYADLTGVPATFPPAAHIHDAGDITSGVLNPLRVGTGTPDGTKFLRDDGSWQVPPSASGVWGAITGTIADQPDLQTALDGKADQAHTHPIDNIDGLQDALDAKIPTASASTIGLAILGASTAQNARTALNIYVTPTAPSSPADGALWIY
jgi:hypothetical protein